MQKKTIPNIKHRICRTSTRTITFCFSLLLQLFCRRLIRTYSFPCLKVRFLDGPTQPMKKNNVYCIVNLFQNHIAQKRQRKRSTFRNIVKPMHEKVSGMRLQRADGSAAHIFAIQACFNTRACITQRCSIHQNNDIFILKVHTR